MTTPPCICEDRPPPLLARTEFWGWGYAPHVALQFVYSSLQKHLKMVTVTGYSLRQQKEGEKKQYISLDLEGDIEMVQSQQSGRFYATVRRCTISSTFDEATAARMIGRQMAGSIERVPCEAYDYTMPETGEVVKLGYKWDYQPEGGKRMVAPRLKETDLSKPVVAETSNEVLTEQPA